MLILPSVQFSSQEHPLVRFCLKLRLWSKPTLSDAELTADLLFGALWIPVAFTALMIAPNLGLGLAIISALDLIGRALGIRSTFCFIPIWILAIGLALIFTLAGD